MLVDDVGELGGDVGGGAIAVTGGEVREVVQVAEEQRHVDRVDEVFRHTLRGGQAHRRLRHYVLQPALMHAEHQRRHERNELSIRPRHLGDCGPFVGAGGADRALDVGTKHLHLGRRHL